MASRFLIYALTDPSSGEVRYIGRSSSGLLRPRRHAHASELAKDETHKARWIRALKEKGLRFGVRVLQELDAEAGLNKAERAWVAEARRLDWPLTNATDGGGGLSGYIVSAEARERIAAKARGKPKTPEHRERLRQALLGRPSDPTANRKRSEALAGRTFSPEHRAAISAAKRGVPLKPEVAAAVREQLARTCRTPEAVAKMAETLRGRRLSPEHRARISEAGRGRTMSAETRARIGAAVRASRAPSTPPG